MDNQETVVKYNDIVEFIFLVLKAIIILTLTISVLGFDSFLYSDAMSFDAISGLAFLYYYVTVIPLLIVITVFGIMILFFVKKKSVINLVITLAILILNGIFIYYKYFSMQVAILDVLVGIYILVNNLINKNNNNNKSPEIMDVVVCILVSFVIAMSIIVFPLLGDSLDSNKNNSIVSIFGKLTYNYYDRLFLQ